MTIEGWNERYRNEARAEDLDAEPTPLLVRTAEKLPPGTALDLACGTGRNAVWLARRGWRVTAVDGAAAAIAILRKKALESDVPIDARVANLECEEYTIESAKWDLVAVCYYLQRSLFEPAKRGVKPGGVLVAIVHITEAGEQSTQSRLYPGELIHYFNDWEILHHYEGKPDDSAHRRAVAEIVARRPAHYTGDRV